MATCFYSEFAKWHRWNKPQLIVFITVEFFLLYSIYAATLVTACVEVVEILYVTVSCKGNGQSIHSMVAMIITFCPIFYTSYLSSIMIFNNLCKPELVVFVPIKFLHYIHKLPILSQAICNRTSCRHNNTYCAL